MTAHNQPAPFHDVELTQIVLDLIDDPRSSARQIGRVIEMVPCLAQRVIDSALSLLKGKGGIKNCAQAVVIIGYRHLERIVNTFQQALNPVDNALTAGPHRLTQPVPEIFNGSELGEAK